MRLGRFRHFYGEDFPAIGDDNKAFLLVHMDNRTVETFIFCKGGGGLHIIERPSPQG